ncbi:hypothetical protein DL764_000543 [Monosporascus ibericus]|uniref:Uncharacterized protein n=1 Tax=Monosporascus ibericus TaxID=155417 RepID=A0A4Q4TY58_9PEZI|nr:hypothetical protein DL764_000543 [Monosporascus ibericus]
MATSSTIVQQLPHYGWRFLRAFWLARPEFHSHRIRNVQPDGMPGYYDSAAERPQQWPLVASALMAAPAGPAGAARPVDLQSLATNALAAVSATAPPTDGDDQRLPDGESRRQGPKPFLSSRKRGSLHSRSRQGPEPP